MREIVVIGAGAAGMAAATRARRVDPSASITVLEASGEYSRGTCSLPYYISGEIADAASLTGISREELSEARIDLRLRAPVQALETRERQVRLASGAHVRYDRLIVSTGSRSKAVPQVGTPEHPRLWTLRRLADAEHIQTGLAELRPRRVAVIGGGYLGLEMAEVLTQRRCQVTLFHRQSSLLRLSQPCQQFLLEELTRQGVIVKTDCEVRLVDPDCRQRTVEFHCLREGRQSEGFDAVFMAPGIEPDARLLSSAGARLGTHGGALVDRRGETSLSGVLAAGDGVEHACPGGSRFVPLATTAARLGRVCGENAAGGSQRMPEPLGCIAVRLFSLQVASVGHPADWTEGESQTVDFGSPANTFGRRRAGRATFYTERRQGRLLGAQFVAPEAASLADLASLAVAQRLSLADLQNLESCYTPPLSSLWHPFYLASRQAEKAAGQSQEAYR